MKLSHIVVGTVIAFSTIAFVGSMKRIATGEVGIRVNASKEIQGTELMPGTWNQTLVGSVLTFPTRDIALSVENRNYVTADTSALSDFDVTVVYGINPTSVAEIYSSKSKSFHAVESDGDILLMYSYLQTLVDNAAQKAVRKYKALEVTDKRLELEQSVIADVKEKLAAEGLGNAITLTAVQVKSILPNKEILASATKYVAAQNELRIKETEVAIAEKEAQRQKALSDTGPQTIAYMQAQALTAIAEGVKTGKVQAVVVPYDFKGIINLK